MITSERHDLRLGAGLERVDAQRQRQGRAAPRVQPGARGGKPVLRMSAAIGTAAKFATPGVGAGHLYVGTRDGHVLAFGSPVTQALSGAGTEFPPTTIGTHSEKTMTLTANEELEITKLESSQPSEFALGAPSRPKPWQLNSGETISIPITFAPAATGPRGATLMATISTGQTVQFSLTGQGQTASAQLEASPTVLSFGGTAIGSSVSSVASFTNVGASGLKVIEASAPGAPFRVEAQDLPPKGRELKAGESVAVPVTFEPTAAGSYGGSITLQTTAGTASVQLTGTAAPPGVLQVAPEAVDFGGVTVGHEATRSFAVSNTGGVGITIFKSKPPTEGAFTATSSLPEDTTIAPGETLVETVRFAPSAPGQASATWPINGEGSTSVHEIRFSGIGETLSAPLTPPLGGGVLPSKTGALGALLAGSSIRAARNGTLSVRVRCPAQPGSCKGTVALRTRRRVRVRPRQRTPSIVTLATAPFTVAGGHTGTIKLRLTPSGRTLLSRDRTMRIAVLVTSRDGRGLRHDVHALATLLAESAAHRH